MNMSNNLEPLNAAYDAICSMLDLLRKDGPLPAGFWDDPFVLGFIAYCIEAVATQAGAEPDDFQDVPAVYLSLLEGNGLDVFQQSYKFHVEKNADFERGVEVGQKFLTVAYGSLAHEDDPAIIQARAVASETVERMRREGEEVSMEDAVFGYLLEGLFFQEIRNRLGDHRKLN